MRPASLRGAAAAAALLLAACTAPPAGPPEVSWGSDECSHCHMILGEQRFAAVARGGGQEARFDDLGCLGSFLDERPGDTAWQVWVHDAGGPAWVPATAAWYSHHPGLATPMGSGLRAWPTREAAARSGAEPFSWSALRERAPARHAPST